MKYSLDQVGDVAALTNYDALGFHVEDSSLVGSVHIFGQGADIDLLVRVHGGQDWQDCANALTRRGWKNSEKEVYECDESNWFSTRKGGVNLLVTRSEPFYDAFVLASDLCKGLAERGKLTYDDRDTRVFIHKHIREAYDV